MTATAIKGTLGGPSHAAPKLMKVVKLLTALALLAIPRIAFFAHYPRVLAILAVAVAAFYLIKRLNAPSFKGELTSWTGLLAGSAISFIAMLPSGERNNLLFHEPFGLVFLAPVSAHLIIGTWMAVKAYRIATGAFRLRLETAFAQLFSPNFARLAAGDVNLMSYLLWWARPIDVPAEQKAYSYARQARPYFVALSVFAAIEAAVAHLLLMNASDLVRWAIFVVDDIGILYLLAFTASLSKLPILVSPDFLRIRAGTLIDQRIRIEDVVGVKAVLVVPDSDKAMMLKASLLNAPNVIVELKSQEWSEPLFGKRKPFRSVGIHPDEPAAFIEDLRRRIALN